MKKIILLLILGVSLWSCKKKPCWECKSTEYIGDKTNVTSTDVCDKSEEEIRQYEKDHHVQDDNKVTVVTCTRK